MLFELREHLKLHTDVPGSIYATLNLRFWCRHPCGGTAYGGHIGASSIQPSFTSALAAAD